MTVAEIIRLMNLTEYSQGAGLDAEVRGGYVSDMLSDVMAHCQRGYIWITIQSHRNVVAVASLVEAAGVILAAGVVPPDDVVEKARDEGVVLLSTPLSAFEMCGRLYELGIRGDA
jgi:predicted transcriptional regulator